MNTTDANTYLLDVTNDDFKILFSPSESNIFSQATSTEQTTSINRSYRGKSPRFPSTTNDTDSSDEDSSNTCNNQAVEKPTTKILRNEIPVEKIVLEHAKGICYRREDENMQQYLQRCEEFQMKMEETKTTIIDLAGKKIKKMMVKEAMQRKIMYKDQPVQRFDNISKWYSNLSFSGVYDGGAEDMFAICFGIFRGDDQYAIKIEAEIMKEMKFSYDEETEHRNNDNGKRRRKKKKGCISKLVVAKKQEVAKLAFSGIFNRASHGLQLKIRKDKRDTSGRDNSKYNNSMIFNTVTKKFMGDNGFLESCNNNDNDINQVLPNSHSTHRVIDLTKEVQELKDQIKQLSDTNETLRKQLVGKSNNKNLPDIEDSNDPPPQIEIVPNSSDTSVDSIPPANTTNIMVSRSSASKRKDNEPSSNIIHETPNKRRKTPDKSKNTNTGERLRHHTNLYVHTC